MTRFNTNYKLSTVEIRYRIGGTGSFSNYGEKPSKSQPFKPKSRPPGKNEIVPQDRRTGVVLSGCVFITSKIRKGNHPL